jgi:hypothetical protein
VLLYFQELDPDTRVAQVECVKDCMYTCANYPTHLESKPGCSTALPPLALPLEQAEQLIQALVLIARASIMRRVEEMQSLGAKEDADQHGRMQRFPPQRGVGVPEAVSAGRC